MQGVKHLFLVTLAETTGIEPAPEQRETNSPATIYFTRSFKQIIKVIFQVFNGGKFCKF
jgi:hypothetical protein